MPSHSHAINWAWNGGQEGNGDWRIIVQGKNVAPDSGTVEDASKAIVSKKKGGGASHENMPPYIRCYTWRRTA
jgi:hypothetical protein